MFSTFVLKVLHIIFDTEAVGKFLIVDLEAAVVLPLIVVLIIFCFDVVFVPPIVEDANGLWQMKMKRIFN